MSLTNDHIILVEPTATDKAAVLEYRDEFMRSGETAHGSGDIEQLPSFEAWLQACADGKHQAKTLPGYVPATQYLAIREADNQLVGMLQLRHELSEFLKLQGGHIGYSVRQSERRKGYATQMLKAALVACGQLGIQKVLLTCVPENIGSASVMKANGGVYDKQVTLENGKKFDHYWINLSE